MDSIRYSKIPPNSKYSVHDELGRGQENIRKYCESTIYIADMAAFSGKPGSNFRISNFESSFRQP